MPTIAELFEQAFHHHQNGHLGMAESLYRQVLQAEPRHADAWHLLGLIAGQVGRDDMAAQYIGQALRLNPGFADAHNNLGHVLWRLGKLAEAEACCREALRLKSRFASAHNNLGNVLWRLGKVEEAEPSYREALNVDPDYAEARNNLGIVLSAQGKLQEAEACCREALRLQPRYAEAHNSLGSVLWSQGRLAEAEASYREAVRLRPEFANAHSNLGAVLRDQGKLAEAEASFREALRLRPGHAEIHTNLGNVLRNQGRLDEAETSYREALQIRPGLAEAHNGLGIVFSERGNLPEAEARCREALRLKQDFAEAHNALGSVLGDQGKLEEAEVCIREALRLQPAYADAHTNLSFHLLLRGDFAHGWAEYEWRRQTKDLRDGPSRPGWDGSSLNGQSILLQAEQGLGDTLEFVRYAQLVKAKGGRVVLQCQPALARIVATCPGVDQVVAAGTPPPACDLTAPLLSLPWLSGTTMETIPAEVPYFAADPARAEIWRTRLAAIPGFKVGICWQGNPQFKRDRLRSVPLASFAPLAAVPGVCLVALQRGQGLEQIAQQSQKLSIVNFPGRSEDPADSWLDTAALIQALDLIISTDTAVVHLAGALGAPTWVALSFIPDWRWLLNREDSPWYPTLRLFRQRKPGDWPEVFQRIATALHQLVAAQKTIPRKEEPR
jgi:Flp pilus assembly protein TadD